MECIKFFDIFSRIPKLKVDGKERLSSIYVSVLGIFILIGYLIFALILSLDIFKKETFYMIENTNSKTFNNFTLDTKIPVSALITNNLGVELKDHERIFNMKLRYFEYFPDTLNQNANYKITIIDHVKCTYNKLAGDTDVKYEDHFKIYKTRKCFDLKPYNISIFGEDSPGTPQGSLVLYLNQCVNTTETSNCLPQEEIDKYLSEVKLSFIYPNKDIDNKLSNPIVDYTAGGVFRFSNTLKTKYIFEIDSVEYLSDEGLYFEEIVKYESYRVEKISSTYNLDFGSLVDPGTIGNINFFGSGKKKIFQRRYKKLHEIVPYLFSIYHVALLSFKFLVKYFGGGRLDEYLFSKLIEKEEFDKFKISNQNIIYDDLFKKIPPQEESQIENENIERNRNEENFGELENCHRELRKMDEINDPDASHQRENEEINCENHIFKKEKEKVKRLKNNFFPEEEKKEESNVQNNNVQVEENVHKDQENSQGIILPIRNTRKNFKMKRKIKQNPK